MGVIVWGGGGILLGKEVSEVGKQFSCPEEFKKGLKSCDMRELINLVRDLSKFPEDAEFLEATKAELNVQAKAAITRQKGKGDHEG